MDHPEPIPTNEQKYVLLITEKKISPNSEKNLQKIYDNLLKDTSLMVLYF